MFNMALIFQIDNQSISIPYFSFFYGLAKSYQLSYRKAFQQTRQSRNNMVIMHKSKLFLNIKLGQLDSDSLLSARYEICENQPSSPPVTFHHLSSLSAAPSLYQRNKNKINSFCKYCIPW